MIYDEKGTLISFFFAGVIKDLLAEELKLPRDKMKITGWSSSRVEPHDEVSYSHACVP